MDDVVGQTGMPVARLVACELVCHCMVFLPFAVAVTAPETSVPIVIVNVEPERAMVALKTVGPVTKSR